MKRFAYVSRRMAAVSACVAMAGAVGACGSDDPGGGESGGEATASESTPAPSGDKIIFGALAGVTGDYAPFTKVAMYANNIAIEDINAEGGVLGKQVELAVADTESTGEAAVPAFDRLTEVSKAAVLSGGDSDAII